MTGRAAVVVVDRTESGEYSGPETVELVRKAGGAPLGAYREPLGGRPLLLASLPFNAVQPTPFQRDLSPTHTKRLAEKIDQAGVFLDPLIVVRGQDGEFWTPNGRHRLAAAKVLGLTAVELLQDPKAVAAGKADFAERMKGRTYTTAIPKGQKAPKAIR